MGASVWGRNVLGVALQALSGAIFGVAVVWTFFFGDVALDRILAGGWAVWLVAILTATGGVVVMRPRWSGLLALPFVVVFVAGVVMVALLGFGVFVAGSLG